MAKKNNLYINIKDDDAQLAKLADFLRDGEISSRSIVALSAFYLSLSIARDPTSTPADIRKAEHYCLSLLKQQMCYIMDKHYREDGIKMDADEFSTVTINQPALSNLGLLPLVQSSSLAGVASSSVPSQSSDIAVQEIAIVKKAEDKDEYDEEEDEEDEDDDEDDDESQMSNEEYLASKQHLLSVEIIK